MGDVKLLFSDFPDVRKAARDLLTLAGGRPEEIRTADDGFVVSEEFAREHGLDADAEKSNSGDSAPVVDAEGPFDPSEHTVAEVLAYLGKASTEERARVIAVERSGKSRQTILAQG